MRYPTFIMLGAILAGLDIQPVAAQEPPPPAPPQRMERRAPPEARPMLERAGRLRDRPIFAPQLLLDRRDQLGLSAEQVAELERLAAGVRATRDAATAAAEPLRAQLDEALRADRPNPEQVLERARALMETRQRVALAELESGVRAKAVLSPEQRGRVQGWADRRPGPREMRMRLGPRGGSRRAPLRSRPFRFRPLR